MKEVTRPRLQYPSFDREATYIPESINENIYHLLGKIITTLIVTGYFLHYILHLHNTYIKSSHNTQILKDFKLGL